MNPPVRPITAITPQALSSRAEVKHAPDAGSSAPLHAWHEDSSLLILEKPAGLLAVPGRGPDKADCLLARAQAHWGELHVVHRLDMATSGLIVYARHLEALRVLSRAFAERRVEKRYEALVWGHPASASTDADGWSSIDLPLSADWPARPRQRVDLDAGKPSQTQWRALSPWGEHTRVLLRPLTGRTHQLRIHMLALGHPILGDGLYAHDSAARALGRLALHASGLRLQHPLTGERMDLVSPSPF